MTKKERKILMEMYKSLEHISSPPIAEYDSNMRRITDDINAAKWLKDPGYVKGWEQARVTVYLWLRELGFPQGGR